MTAHKPPSARAVLQEERRVLVTLHLPLEMHCAAMILKAVAAAYPAAVMGENGAVWSRREEAPKPPDDLHRIVSDT